MDLLTRWGSLIRLVYNCSLRLPMWGLSVGFKGQSIILCGCTCWIYYKVTDYASPPFTSIQCISFLQATALIMSATLLTLGWIILGPYSQLCLASCLSWILLPVLISVRGVIFYFRTSEGLYWYIKLFCLSTVPSRDVAGVYPVEV